MMEGIHRRSFLVYYAVLQASALTPGLPPLVFIPREITFCVL